MVDWTPPAGLAKLISDVGAVKNRLGDTLREFGISRPMIVCGRNIAATPLVAQVRAAAGLDCTLFDGSVEHTPVEAVDAGIAAARAARPDALIALGGSSAIDLAKAITVALRLELSSARDIQPISFTTLPFGEAGELVERMPLICIPTTLSGAEFQPFFGMRDPEARHKQPFAEQGLVSRIVIHDGEIAASTPGRLWVETGVKSLDDCFMRYCAGGGMEPAWDAAQITALRGLLDGLEAGGRGDPEARQANFFHLWLSACPIPRATPFAYRPWLSIAVRHQLGGMVGMAHGAGSCVAMVESLRFHRAATRERQAELALALGVDDLPAFVSARLDVLGVPRRIGDLGVDPAVSDELAAAVLHEAPAMGGEEEVRAACARLW